MEIVPLFPLLSPRPPTPSLPHSSNVIRANWLSLATEPGPSSGCELSMNFAKIMGYKFYKERFNM